MVTLADRRFERALGERAGERRGDRRALAWMSSCGSTSAAAASPTFTASASSTAWPFSAASAFGKRRWQSPTPNTPMWAFAALPPSTS